MIPTADIRTALVATLAALTLPAELGGQERGEVEITIGAAGNPFDEEGIIYLDWITAASGPSFTGVAGDLPATVAAIAAAWAADPTIAADWTVSHAGAVITLLRIADSEAGLVYCYDINGTTTATHVNGTAEDILFESVAARSTADLEDALEDLRDTPDTMAVVVPGEDEWIHEVLPDSFCVRSESRNRFELLVAARDLDMGADGVDLAAAVKDHVTDSLLWSDLGIEGLLLLPLSAQPVLLERDGRVRGRECWRITLEARRILST